MSLRTLLGILFAFSFVGCAPQYKAVCNCNGGGPSQTTVCGSGSQDFLCSEAIQQAAQGCAGGTAGCTCTKGPETLCLSDLSRIAEGKAAELLPIPDPKFQ
jgi:hypothetical protein